MKCLVYSLITTLTLIMVAVAIAGFSQAQAQDFAHDRRTAAKDLPTLLHKALPQKVVPLFGHGRAIKQKIRASI